MWVPFGPKYGVSFNELPLTCFFNCFNNLYNWQDFNLVHRRNLLAPAVKEANLEAFDHLISWHVFRHQIGVKHKVALARVCLFNFLLFTQWSVILHCSCHGGNISLVLILIIPKMILCNIFPSLKKWIKHNVSTKNFLPVWVALLGGEILLMQ